MRLLRAELAKLRRPLLAWTFVAMAVFVALSAWSVVGDAHDEYVSIQRGDEVTFAVPTSCAEIGLPEGSQCQQELRRAQQAAQEEMREYPRRVERRLAVARALQHPLGDGTLVAGMLASMPGAMALLLLAAGHVGNEWSGRTIKQVLAQEGRRWRVLLAKLVSLWLAGVGLLLATWAVLALLSLWFGQYELGPRLSMAAAWNAAGLQFARALLVLAAFAVVGVLAAVVTRNTLGSFVLAIAFVVGSLMAANYPATVRGTLSYWVAGWMGFRVGETVPFYLWPGSFPDAVPPPSHRAGLYGLVGLVVVGGLLAVARVARSDVEA